MSSLFAELYEKSVRNIKEGDVVQGTIISIRQKEVVVDISYKSEGILSLDEFSDPTEIKVGDEISVLFESFDDESGVAVLSKRKADRQRTWNELLSNAQEGNIVDGRIFKKVRGGFMVDIGMEAFLPASLVETKPVRNLDQYLGLSDKFMIVKINHKRKNVVVSRKDYLEREKAQAREKKFETLQVGQTIKGKVKNITDFGVFLDLGELDGLLHITDMSWGRISHPSDLVKLGDELDVAVISVDKENRKVSLGLKQKSPNPWDSTDEKYSIGTLVHGKVVNLLPYGAFVELEPGVEGLVHISEFSWTKRVTHPSEMLKIGDLVDVIVLSMDKENKKISLGMKQIQDNPWDSVLDKYQVGNRVKGTVRNLTDYGAFIELEPGVDGLVHVSDLSWTHKVNKPSDLLKKGEAAEVMVLSVDTENRKISLGIKQLTDDPWEQLTKDLYTGTQVAGKIIRIVNYGVFVELENGLEGLVHISEIPGVSAQELEKHFKPGQTIEVSILHIDHEGRKIALTRRDESLSNSSTSR